MRVAVIGCLHGELEDMYKTIEQANSRLSSSSSSSSSLIELVVVCGDFQSLRSEADLPSLHVPPKYKTLGSFADYFNGIKTASVLTIFIGGNHEASNLLSDHRLGGFIAPNIYYMGNEGVVNYKGYRIGGISGIYNYHNYRKGRYEKVPYNDDDIRSIYHIREIDTFRLLHLDQRRRRIDMFLSHDWPQRIWDYGKNSGQQLLRMKPFFRDDMMSGKLGSPPLRTILDHIQPRFWFAAHLHVKFAAVYPHATTAATASTIDEGNEMSGSSSSSSSSDVVTGRVSRFLSLDKLLPGRDFLQILDIPLYPSCDTSSDTSSDTSFSATSASLEYDAEWLAILKKTLPLQSSDRVPPPLNFTTIIHCSKEDMDAVTTTILLANQGTLVIPHNSTQLLLQTLGGQSSSSSSSSSSTSSSSSSSSSSSTVAVVATVDQNAIDIDDI